jgi:hypothetical protein
VPVVLKSGSLNLLEPYGPVKNCNGIALTFYLKIIGTVRICVHFLTYECCVKCSAVLTYPNVLRELFNSEYGKGKAIPLQAWKGPKGFQRVYGTVHDAALVGNSKGVSEELDASVFRAVDEYSC